jgi:hypothetical protein
MKTTLLTIAAILILACTVAHADIWRWTDANGDVHYVDTKTPIYTWLDDYGMVQFADKPGHESAVSVDLVWHSTADSVATAEAQEETDSAGSGWTHPDETEEERLEREKAEQYYCKRAQDIYDSYLSAPRLYETDTNGEKVYLTDEQAAAKIKETEHAVAQVCR